ncbi:MAG: HAD family phosphatase [Candidatus Promineifilaceae bacterium]
MIKTIIFDIGGVLLKTEDRTPRHKLDEQFGLPYGTVEELVFNSEQGRRAQLGELSTEAHWQLIGKQFELDEDALAAVRLAFWAGDRLDESLVAYIRQLKQVYETAVISNAFDDLRHVLTHEFQIADAFNLLVISAEEGIMKPDARIFARTLARLGRKPEEAVFIDDFVHNVEGAKAVGLHAIHYQPGTNLPQKLAELGVHVNANRPS